MKRRRFLAGTVGALVLVLVTVGLVGLAQAKPDKPRFTILPSDNAWVLDSTTALQWQRAPDFVGGSWSTASTFCTNLGGGSRLPEIKELISLVEYTKFYPALPEGHPFQGVQSALYWSATTGGLELFNGWVVDFSSGAVNNIVDSKHFAWCVR